MLRNWIAVLLLAAASSAGLAQPGPVPATNNRTTSTVQEAFEAATKLSDDGKDYPAALAAWQALEHRVAGAPRSLAIVRLRKGHVLFELGRNDEAAAAAHQGLAALSTSDPTLVSDRYQAWTELASIAMASIDYGTAAEDYAEALAIAPDPASRMASLRGKIAANTFFDQSAALTDVATLDRELATAKVEGQERGVLLITEAELYLNLKRFGDAQKAADAAVKALGGLTQRVDHNDLVARGDAAIAYLLEGKEEEARKFMAWTGAGIAAESSINPADAMETPQCDVEGLKPDDVAVVEFGVGNDGAVFYARPVYASGGPQAGLAFARTARDWVFDPELVQKMRAFFRVGARVELRCTDAFRHSGVEATLTKRLVDWLVEAGARREGTDEAFTPRQRLASLRAEIAKLDQDKQSGAPLIAALLLAASNALTPREEAAHFAERAYGLLPANTPPIVRLAVESVVWRTKSYRNLLKGNFYRDTLPQLERPEYSADPEARAALTLLLADSAPRQYSDAVRALLLPVAADTALDSHDSFRQGALIRLASLEAAHGREAAATAAFQSSGVSAGQCALADFKPHLVRAGGVFPDEARRWGFEGWVQTEFDVTADGRTINVRPIVAYPAFVFSKAAAKTVEDSRFAKTFRPTGELGCGADRQRVRFTMHF